MANESTYEDVNTNGETEAEVKDQVDATDEDNQGACQTAHDERVAHIAAQFATLVAKGEEVLAALNAKAGAMDSSFTEKGAAVAAQLDEFASTVQMQVEKAADQFTRDLDVIAQAADRPAQEDVANTPTSQDGLTDSVADVSSHQPRFTPAARIFRERMRVGAASDLMLTDPEFVERFANFAFDDVPAVVDLPDRTRFMCWLATLLGCQGIDEFRTLLPAALNMGVEPAAVKEIVYQASAYLGIGRVYPFLKATNDILMAAGVELPLKPQATTLPTEESRYEGGERAQCEAIGEQMRGFKDKGDPDYPWIAQWLVKNCFGDWYTRGGLTMSEREMITFCFIAAQGGCENQLRSHTAANVQCGNDREFLIKVVSNNVPFIGYPRSLNAMAAVDEVTGKRD